MGGATRSDWTVSIQRSEGYLEMRIVRTPMTVMITWLLVYRQIWKALVRQTVTVYSDSSSNSSSFTFSASSTSLPAFFTITLGSHFIRRSLGLLAVDLFTVGYNSAVDGWSAGLAVGVAIGARLLGMGGGIFTGAKFSDCWVGVGVVRRACHRHVINHQFLRPYCGRGREQRVGFDWRGWLA